MNRLLLSLGCALALFGCSEAAPIDPTAGGGGGTGGSPPDPPDPPKVKRTVIERNPFGNVEASHNLLWDGDFEWSSPFSDQYGWYEPPATPVISDIVIGAGCRSGIKCARVARRSDVLGIAVGSASLPLSASVWVRFEPVEGLEAPTCEYAQASVIDAGFFQTVDETVDLVPDGPNPDAEGWCHLSASVPVRANKPYLHVTNRSDAPMILDDAVLLAVDRMPNPLPAGRTMKPSERSAEWRERLARAREAIKKLSKPADGKPNEAKRALERHMEKRGAR